MLPPPTDYDERYKKEGNESGSKKGAFSGKTQIEMGLGRGMGQTAPRNLNLFPRGEWALATLVCLNDGKIGGHHIIRAGPNPPGSNTFCGADTRVPSRGKRTQRRRRKNFGDVKVQNRNSPVGTRNPPA